MSFTCLKLFNGFLWYLKTFKNLFTRAYKTLWDPDLLIFSTSYFLLTLHTPAILDFFLFQELAKFSFFENSVLVFPLLVMLFLLIIMWLVLSCNSNLILNITSLERFSLPKVPLPTSTKLLHSLLLYLFPQ